MRLSTISAAVAVTLFATSAQAAITVYTTQAAFNAASTGLVTDTYADLAEQLYPSPLTRTVGGFSYQAVGTNGIFPGSNGANIFLSLNTATDDLVLQGFTPSVSAVGGVFFASNVAGDPIASPSITLTVTDTAGSVVEVILNPTPTSFRGFVSTATISSLRIGSPTVGLDNRWASVDDLRLGQRANNAIPEPAAWALMIAGFGLAGSAMRRRNTNVAFA